MFRIAIILCLSLTACADTVVTQYNGSSIRIQSNSRQVTPYVVSEAQRICGTQGLQAEFASTTSRPNDIFTHYHLFLCLSHAKPNAGLATGSAQALGYLESTATL